MSLESITKAIREEISRLNQVLRLLGGVQTTTRRKMSAAGRARISAAQKARWAMVKGQRTPKRKLAAGRRRIAEAQRARWAKIRAAKK